MTFSFIGKKSTAPVHFHEIALGFMVSSYKGVTYMERWRRHKGSAGSEEPMEVVLYDYIRNEYSAMPANVDEFNLLISAMIIAAEGGNAVQWLVENGMDYTEFANRQRREMDEYRTDLPRKSEPAVIYHQVRFYAEWQRRFPNLCDFMDSEETHQLPIELTPTASGGQELTLEGTVQSLEDMMRRFYD